MVADLHTLETYSQTQKRQPRHFKFILLMSLCGFASGIVTANLAYTRVGYLMGAPFGLALAFSLAISGIMSKMWKAISLVAITAVAFYISWFLTGFVELSFPWKHLPTGGAPTTSPVSLFTGGMTGGFIVLSGVLLLTNAQSVTSHTILWKVLLWSTFSGVLAPIAWALGPSVGALIVTDRRLYAIPEFSNQCALYVIWQTGMGFALGMTLRKVREKQETSSSEVLKIT